MLHSRLTRAGLVEPQTQTAMTLGALMDRFTAAATVKPATLAAYAQAVSSLRAILGLATPVRSLTPADADR
jgi:hypothetical protein